VVVYTSVPQDGTGSANDPLVALAKATGGRFLLTRDDRQIANTFVQVLDEFRQRYLLTYSPAGVARAGRHRIDVSVRRRGATVRAQEGYEGGT
jgi:hypothetical protein